MIDFVPTDTTNKLYNNGGELFFNGEQIGGEVPPDLDNIESIEMIDFVPTDTTNKLYNNNGQLSFNGEPLAGEELIISDVQKTYSTFGQYGAPQELLLPLTFNSTRVNSVISESGYMVFSFANSMGGGMGQTIEIYVQQPDKSWVPTAQSPLTLTGWNNTWGSVCACDNNMLVVGVWSDTNNLANATSRINLYVWNAGTQEMNYVAFSQISSGSNTNYGVSNIDIKNNIVVTDMAFLDGQDGQRKTRRNGWRYDGVSSLNILSNAWSNSVQAGLDQIYNSAYYTSLQVFEILGVGDFIMYSFYVTPTPGSQRIITIYKVEGTTTTGIQNIIINRSNFYPNQTLAQLLYNYVDTTTVNQNFLFVSIPGTNNTIDTTPGPDSQIRCYRWTGTEFTHTNDIDFSNFMFGYGGQVRITGNGLLRPMRLMQSGNDLLTITAGNVYPAPTDRQITVFNLEKSDTGALLTILQTIHPSNSSASFLNASFSMENMIYMDTEGTTAVPGNLFQVQHRLPVGSITVDYKHIEDNLKVDSLYVKDEGIFKLPLDTAGNIGSRQDIEDGMMVFDKTQGILKLWYQNQWSVWSPISGFGCANFNGYIPNSGNLSLQGELLNSNGIQILNNTPSNLANKLYNVNGSLYWLDTPIKSLLVENVEINTDFNLSVYDNNKCFYVNQSTPPFTIRLPQLIPNFSFKFNFTIGTTGSSDVNILTESNLLNMKGILIIPTGISRQSGKNGIIFRGSSDGSNRVSDNIEIISNGSNGWMYRAFGGDEFSFFLSQ